MADDSNVFCLAPGTTQASYDAALARAHEVFAPLAAVVAFRASKLSRAFSGKGRGKGRSKTAAARAARLKGVDVSAADLCSHLWEHGFVLGRLPKTLHDGLEVSSARIMGFLEAMPPPPEDASEDVPAAAKAPALEPIHNGKAVAVMSKGKLKTHVAKSTRLSVIRSLYYQALASKSYRSGETRVKAIYDYVVGKLEEAFPGQLEFLAGCSSYLLSLADEDQQTKHPDGDAHAIDAKEHAKGVVSQKGKLAPSVSVIVALSGKVRLRVWRGSHHVIRRMVEDEGFTGDISKSEVIEFDVGDYVVFTHDFIHAGMDYDVKNLRLHIFGDSRWVKRQDGAAYRMVDIVSAAQAQRFHV